MRTLTCIKLTDVEQLLLNAFPKAAARTLRAITGGVGEGVSLLPGDRVLVVDDIKAMFLIATKH